MPNSNRVFVPKEQLSLDVIKQYRVDVSSIEEKDTVLKEYILNNADRLGQTIIFVASRRTAQALFEVSIPVSGIRRLGMHIVLHQPVPKSKTPFVSGQLRLHKSMPFAALIICIGTLYHHMQSWFVNVLP